MGWIEKQLEDKLGDLAAAVALEGERTRDQVAAALEQTIRGARMDAAEPRALRAGVIFAGAGRLVGWSARESGGTAPVAVDLYDGGSSAAVDPSRLVASFSLPTGGSSAEGLMPGGVSFTEGLYAVFTGTGVPTGAVWRGAVD